MVQDKRGQLNFLKCKKLFYIATIRTSANQGRNLKFVSILSFLGPTPNTNIFLSLKYLQIKYDPAGFKSGSPWQRKH